MLPRLSRCFLPQSGGLYRPWTPPRTTWWSGIWGKWSISLLWPTSCLWKNVLKCNPGPAEASKLSLDGPCDPLTGPGQDHDEPDVPELSSNDVFFNAFQLLANKLFSKMHHSPSKSQKWYFLLLWICCILNQQISFNFFKSSAPRGCRYSYSPIGGGAL